MISFIFLFVFTGSYLIYFSSNKMVKTHNVENTFLRIIPLKYLKPLGLIFLSIAGIFTLKYQGLEAGSYALIVYIMGSLSLVILLIPYKILSWKHLIIIFIVIMFLELCYENQFLTHYASK